MKSVAWCCLVAAALGYTPARAAESVSIESMLDEMIDRDAVARFPQFNFRLRQQSSYDRRSKTPDDRDGWFANKDHTSQFVRVETKGGRREWVLMEHDGPGVLVRSWMPDKRVPSGGRTPVNATVRIYLDGEGRPAIEGHALDLFNGTGLIPRPFAHKSLASAVSFFPIPYAKSCKITLDEQPFFFIYTYRQYPAGTPIRTFTMANFRAARPKIERVGKALIHPAADPTGERVTIATELKPGAGASVALPAGAGALRDVSLKLGDYTDPQVMRSVVLKIEFDGKETVWCPVGDFFGSGVGLHPFIGWWRTVAEDGTMACRWVMPYRKSGRITLVNLHKQPVTVNVAAAVGDWTWDDRTMYFHAGWRHEYPVPTRPFSDFNYNTLTGRGVYVGDTLTVMNPLVRWWGEGDAKIWVDGERFPSIFGTGTEDYYGYSWGGKHTAFYEHPFHAQVRVGKFNKVNLKKPPFERDTKGYSTETRTRALDTMPFGKSLQVDMEVWHWEPCDMAYAVGSYWYGFAATTTNRTPAPKEAAKPFIPPPANAPAPPTRPAGRVKRFDNAIECEVLKATASRKGVKIIRKQNLKRYGMHRWSGGQHMFVRDTKVGDFVDLRVPVKGDQAVKVLVHATTSHDYGILRFSVNGQRTGKDIDTYSAKVGVTGPIPLGMFTPVDGAITLRAEVVASNPRSKKPATFFGLDCVVIERARK